MSSNAVFGTTVSLGTIALVYVIGAIAGAWPPSSRLALFVFALAAASLPFFGTAAVYTARGLNSLDDIVAQLRGAVGMIAGVPWPW